MQREAQSHKLCLSVITTRQIDQLIGPTSLISSTFLILLSIFLKMFLETEYYTIDKRKLLTAVT